MISDDNESPEEVHLRLMLSKLDKAYRQAAQPYIDRLIEINSLKRPSFVLPMLVQACRPGDVAMVATPQGPRRSYPGQEMLDAEDVRCMVEAMLIRKS